MCEMLLSMTEYIPSNVWCSQSSTITQYIIHFSVRYTPFQGTSVLSPVVPLIYILAPAVLIAWKSPENLYLQNPIVYLLTFGCVSARVTNRLVVSWCWVFGGS